MGLLASTYRCRMSKRMRITSWNQAKADCEARRQGETKKQYRSRLMEAAMSILDTLMDAYQSLNVVEKEEAKVALTALRQSYD